jgi:predicted ATPase
VTRRPRTGGFLRSFALDTDGLDPGVYPFSVPAVQALREKGELVLAPGVTFLTGDNGTGKSTLMEAVAVAAGFNAEGGGKSFHFATRRSHSSLADHLRLAWAPGKPHTGYFLRAESFYNLATELERIDQESLPGLLAAYGGRSLHERSHGESFLDLVVHRFGPNGLYLLDEPESALSVQGCLALLSRIAELVGGGAQFLIATHSPVLIALPGALIIEISRDGGLKAVDYDDAEPVALTRNFLADPARLLRQLLGDARPVRR